MTASVRSHLSSLLPNIWDDEADVIIVGYGFAGSAPPIAAHEAGAMVLLLKKAPEQYKRPQQPCESADPVSAE